MHATTATIAHLWQHLLAKVPHPLDHEYRLLLSLVREGLAVAIMDDGVPIALGGAILDDGNQAKRLWLSVVPSIAPRVLPAAVIGRRLVREWARGHAAGLVCCVLDGNPQGKRLARLLGFQPSDRAAGDVREWRWADGRCRRDGDGQAGEGAGEPRRGGASRAVGAAGG